MRKLSCLVLSLGLASCYHLPPKPATGEEQKNYVVNLNNGYTTEVAALNLLYREADKLIGKDVKTYMGTFHVNNKREAILRLCQLVDGVFWYEDPDWHVSLEELKEYVYRKLNLQFED